METNAKPLEVLVKELSPQAHDRVRQYVEFLLAEGEEPTGQPETTDPGPDATVTSGDNTISGEKITFYRADGRFTVEGGTGGRVTATILPDESSGLE